MFASIPSDLLRPATGYNAVAPANDVPKETSGSDAQGRVVSQHKSLEHGSLVTLMEERLGQRTDVNKGTIGAFLKAIRETSPKQLPERAFVERMAGRFGLTPQERTLALSVLTAQSRTG